MIENNKSLVVISLFKVGENEFLQTLILLGRRDVRKLTCLTAKFQEDTIELLREIAWRSNGI